MLSTFVLTALVTFCLSFAAAQSTACARFESLTCLTSDHAAATICASAPLQTTTITVTTTMLSMETLPQTAHATSQKTVAETTLEESITTVTAGPTQTSTWTHTVNSTEHATMTTYVPVGAANAPLVAGNSSCNAAVLSSMSDGTLATACSCIGKPVRTSTVTIYSTAPAVKQTTTAVVAGTAATTTLYKIGRTTRTTTVAPTSVVISSMTSWTTSTQTVSMAAPTFKHAFGPKEGCIDNAAASTKPLRSRFNNIVKATAECKRLCMQKPDCDFVYVQHLMANHGSQLAYYKCFFNDHKLNASEDLQCGQQEVWGAAMGYNACDRGTLEL